MTRSTTGPDQVATVSSKAPLVALTWAPDEAPAQGSPISVRGLGDDGWSEWVTTEVNAETDPTAERAGNKTRVGTDPVWLGDIEKVQIRYAAPGVRKARVELIDPGTSPADTPASSPPGAAQAMPSQPQFIWRSKWGADESLRTCEPDYARTTLSMVLHHTAGTNSYTKSQSASIVRGIYAYHTKGQGWCDIGYNALVDKYGQVFEGRKGGLDLPVIGAHTGGFNTDTFGVSVLGTYTSAAPSSAAMNSIYGVLAWRSASFYRSATSTSVLTSLDSDSNYPEGTRVTVPFITGHRVLWPTECPGTAFYNSLGAIRSAVASRAGYTDSALYKRWSSLGGANSFLGPVLKGEGAVPFGRRTVFNGGWAMYQVGASATRLVGPATDLVYWRSGGPGDWGYPLGDERAITGGSRVDFKDGHTAVWSKSTGAKALFGGIKNYWTTLGGGASPLGFPRDTEHVLRPSGGVGQTFQNGIVLWSPATHSHAVLRPILDAYNQNGHHEGRLGYPTADQREVADGILQSFQGGEILAPTDGGPPIVTFK
jgi:uncharacterized protein with LGFP repeats